MTGVLEKRWRQAYGGYASRQDTFVKITPSFCTHTRAHATRAENTGTPLSFVLSLPSDYSPSSQEKFLPVSLTSQVEQME